MASLSLVDPLNGRQVMLEHVRHESGHAVGAVMLGFTFDDVAMDRYAEDFGRWGQLSGLRREPLTSAVPTTDDVLADFEALEYAMYRDALDRSIVARLGVKATLEQSWDGPGAAGDRENVESNRPRDYSPAAWDFFVENAASKLLRRDDFRFRHAAVVGALEREEQLTYEQVLAIVAGSPGMIASEMTSIGHAVCRSKRSSASWDPAIRGRPMPFR